MMSRIQNALDNDLSLGGWFLICLAFFFILIGLFIYLEIIELKFCDLNKNTRIKIAERAKETDIENRLSEISSELELLGKDEDEYKRKKEKDKEKIEIAPGYLIEI